MFTAVMKVAVLMLAAGIAGGQNAPAAPASPTTPASPAAPKAPKPPRAPRTARVVNGGSYLGVDTREVTPERALALKLKNPAGVEITMVDQDAPAGKAGLREHDVLLTFNGKKVDDHEALARMIRETAPGTKVTLGIVREGQAMSLTAQLARRSQVYTMLAPGKSIQVTVPEIHMPPMPAMDFDFPQFSVLQFWARNGLVVEDLSPQLAEFFGVKGGEGVLVRSVEKGTPAAAAGLKAGDVIVRVNGEQVGCSSDWRAAMRQHKSGAVTLNIIRDKREQTVSMQLPERKSSKAAPSWNAPEFERQMQQMERELERMGPQIDRANAEIDRANALVSGDVERAMEKLQRELERAHDQRERAFDQAQRERERAMERAERARELAERDRERRLEQQQRQREQQQKQQELQQQERQQQEQQAPK